MTVLADLLRLLADGGVHSVRELAVRLDASEGLVAAMAEDLARRGYLVAVEGGCAGACSGCGGPIGPGAACAGPNAARPALPLFVLTPQGRRAAG